MTTASQISAMHPMPRWVTDGLRDHQSTALDAIVEEFEAGNEVVFVDAPTGSGKTLLGQQVANRLDVPALYVCSDKQLQRQFMRDFPYAKLLQGRNNYDTINGPTLGPYRVTADDCTANGGEDGGSCMWCPQFDECPYQVAKQQALDAELAVLNTSYFLSAANYAGSFKSNSLVIVDEADALESALMGFVEFTVPEWIGRALQLTYPKKAVRKPTLILWLEGVASQALDYAKSGRCADIKESKKMRSFAVQCKQVAFELQRDVNAGGADAGDEDTGRWLRDYETRTLTLKPVLVSTFGAKNLWRHSARWLIMSATIISADEMADSLGIPYDWSVVTVPMTFPVENRPIILAPIANVTYKTMDEAVPQLVYAIEQIAKDHPGERMLVHTANYRLNAELYARCRIRLDRRTFSHTTANERHNAMVGYLATPGSVLFSPSMTRGVDLKGDDCRVQIIAKCVFPPLGDKRISARMHLPGGDQWYRVQTVREIVQMTGRAVRSETDHATTYILDAQFTKNLYAKSKYLFPTYWRDAVHKGYDVRHLMLPRVAA